MYSIRRRISLFALILMLAPGVHASEDQRSKPWRDKVCGFWIPSETSTPSGYVVETVTGERLGPMNTAFWNDRWDPDWSTKDRAFVHEVDLKLLVADSVADSTEVHLICTTLFEVSSLVERELWKGKGRNNVRSKECLGEKSQNAALYDDVLMKVKERYPATRVVDIYIVKKWISVDWW